MAQLPEPLLISIIRRGCEKINFTSNELPRIGEKFFSCDTWVGGSASMRANYFEWRQSPRRTLCRAMAMNLIINVCGAGLTFRVRLDCGQNRIGVLRNEATLREHFRSYMEICGALYQAINKAEVTNNELRTLMEECPLLHELAKSQNLPRRVALQQFVVSPCFTWSQATTRLPSGDNRLTDLFKPIFCDIFLPKIALRAKGRSDHLEARRSSDIATILTFLYVVCLLSVYVPL